MVEHLVAFVLGAVVGMAYLAWPKRGPAYAQLEAIEKSRLLRKTAMPDSNCAANYIALAYSRLVELGWRHSEYMIPLVDGTEFYVVTKSGGLMLVKWSVGKGAVSPTTGVVIHFILWRLER